jgi:catalase
LHKALADRDAVPRFIGKKLGRISSTSGDVIEVEVSMEAAPSCVWDAVVVPDGQGSAEALSMSGHAIEFLKDQYRHCKPLLFMGTASALCEKAGLPTTLASGDADPGLLQYGPRETKAALAAFIDALAKHRVLERETDPPRV